MPDQTTNGHDADGEETITANAEGFGSGLRLGLAAALGQSGFADRDEYETFGWPTTEGDWDEDEYLALYLRNAEARTVVDKPALTTWRDDPIIVDDAETDADTTTEFEEAIETLASEKGLWDYASRTDRLAGIGEHGLLLLGFSDIDDTDDWAEPVDEGQFSDTDDLIQFRTFSQAQIDDIEWGGPGDERWGKPKRYLIDLSEDVDDETEGEIGSLRVHYTRVVDVPATRLLDDETLARPRCEPVLNNILDIQKARGATAEMAYRGADYGLHVNFDPEKVDTSNLGDVEEELNDWYHGIQPWIRTTGGEVNRLGGEVSDPGPIVEANLDAIAAQTGIPKKELRGNESGEVTGAEQDEKSYFGMIAERRVQYATPYIVRQSIDRLTRAGVLPDPNGGGYDVEWPDLTQLSEQEIAETQAQRAQVISAAGMALPGLTGERAEAYIETGEFPDREGESANVRTDVDESDPTVREMFTQFTRNARRYSEGDEVDTPDGVGVVAEIRTEPFEGRDGEELEASSDSPIYVVGVEDERVGVGFYRASDLSTTTIDVEGVEDPSADLASNAAELVDNQDDGRTFDYPPSWRKSSTPNRIILLKAWAGLGGRFTTCRREMAGEIASPSRFCASMKDAVLQWEGWRKGG